jgi:hypothetical protein
LPIWKSDKLAGVETGCRADFFSSPFYTKLLFILFWRLASCSACLGFGATNLAVRATQIFEFAHEGFCQAQVPLLPRVLRSRILVICVINATAPSRRVARRVKRRVSANGSKNRRTKITSAVRKNSQRVKEWRKRNAGYRRKKKSSGQAVLQEVLRLQVAHNEDVNPEKTVDVLQDLLLMQPTVVVGLISMMTGSVLQEDIVSTVGVLVRKGRDILGMNPGIRNDSP